MIYIIFVKEGAPPPLYTPGCWRYISKGVPVGIFLYHLPKRITILMFM